MIRKLFVAAFAAFSIFAIGCGSSDDDTAFLRVVHGSPDAPAVDVYLDGALVLSDVPYNVASDFLRIDTGDRRIEVRAAGTDLVVIEAVLNFVDGQANTVVASSFLESITPLVLSDNLIPPSLNEVNVRAVHNAVSAPEVDIYVTAPGADLATETPALAGVPFGVASDFLTIPTGEYQVRATLAGTLTVAIDSGAVTLPGGATFTIVAQDAEGGGAPFQFLVLQDV